MKVESHKAGERLGLHPANMALYLAQMGASFVDVWPTVDEAWVVSLQSRDWQRFGQERRFNVAAESSVQAQTGRPPVSDSAALVIEKLWRSDKWGVAHVSREQMQKHTHLPPSQLDPALHELIERDLLISEGRAGPYSLNPGKRGEIDRIAQLAISRKD